VLSFKVLANKTTAFDIELFAIRLEVSKATSMDIEYIILITDSLVSVMKTVDLSVHFRQAYSQAIYFVIRLFFCGGFGYKIEFWNCPSKAE